MSMNRMVLKINGIEKSFICDRERDSLAEVLNGLGLKGDKSECAAGQCGACNVVFDGKLTCSCMLKMKEVMPYSSVETI